jgi:PAS domain-containing protein
LGLECFEVPITENNTELLAEEFYSENGGRCCTGVEGAFKSMKINLTKDQRSVYASTLSQMDGYRDLLNSLHKELNQYQLDSGTVERDLEDKIKKIQTELRHVGDKRKSKDEILYFYLDSMIDELMDLSADELNLDEKSKREEWEELKENFDPRDDEKDHDEVLNDLKNKDYESKENVKLGKEVVKEMMRQERRILQALENMLKNAIRENQEIMEEVEKNGGVKTDDGYFVFDHQVDFEKSDLERFGYKDDEGRDVDIEAKPTRPEGGKGGKPGTGEGDKPPRPEGGDDKPEGEDGKKPPRPDGEKPGSGGKPKPPRRLEGTNEEIKYSANELFHDLEDLEQQIEESKEKLEELHEMKEELEEKERTSAEEELTKNSESRVESANDIIEQMFSWENKIVLVSRHSEVISEELTQAKELLPTVFEDLNHLLDIFLQLESIGSVVMDLMEDYRKYTSGGGKKGQQGGRGNRKEDDMKKEDEWKGMVENVKFNSEKRVLEEVVTEEGGTEKPEEFTGELSIESEIALLDGEWNTGLEEFKKIREKIENNLDIVEGLLNSVIQKISDREKTEEFKLKLLEDVDARLNKIEELRVKLSADVAKEHEILNDENRSNDERLDALKHNFAFNKIWLQIKPYKEQLAELKTKIENNEHVDDMMEVLRGIVLNPIRLNSLEVVEMVLLIEQWELYRNLGGQNEDTLEVTKKEIEELQSFMTELDMIKEPLRNKENRDKCSRSQFKVLSGVLLAMTSGNATDMTKFDTAGEISAVAVDSNVSEEVMNKCWEIVYSICMVIGANSAFNDFLETVDSDASHQGQVCEDIGKVYNCMLGNSTCDQEFTDLAFQEFFKPLASGFKSGEDPSKVEGVVDKLKDKRSNIKEEDQSAKNAFDNFFAEEDKKDRIDFDGKGTVDVSQDHDKPFGPGHPEGDIDVDAVKIDQDLQSDPKAPQRVLESSTNNTTNGISYSVDQSVKISILSVADNSGLDDSPVEELISDLISLDDKDSSGSGNSSDKSVNIAFVGMNMVLLIMLMIIK